MRENRFYIDTPNIFGQINLPDDVSHQIKKVLRLKPGDKILLLNNKEQLFEAKIISTSSPVVVDILRQIETMVESPVEIHIAQVIGKKDKVETVLQKATELGANTFTLLYSQHSQVRYKSNKEKDKIEHWKKICISASMQSKRTKVPSILGVQDFKDFLSNNHSLTHNLILDPDGTSISKLQSSHKKFTILIGPEGGFSKEEIDIATKQSFKPTKLGPRILRTETAPIAICSILQAKYGDF